MPPIRLRATSGLLSGILNTNIVAALLGDFSGEEYLARYPLPDGVIYDPALGWTTGTPFSISPTLASNEVLLPQQGSRLANRTLVQNTVTNAATDAVTIKCAPGAHDWGDEILVPGVGRTGVGMTVMMAGTLPRAEGKRIQASDVASMPTFLLDRRNAWGTENLGGGNSQLRQVFRIGSGATKVRLLGLDLTVDPTMPENLLPAVDSATFAPAALSGVVGNADATSVYPQTIIVDRCSVRGVPGKAQQRGINMMAGQFAVINSRLEHWHYKFNDSQAIQMNEGGNGVVVENCYIAHSFGEGFMIGGSSELYDGNGDFLPARVPTNIVVRRNHFDHPAAYRQAGYFTKALLESKGGRHAIVERNRFSGQRFDAGMFGGQRSCIIFKFSTAAGHQWCLRLNEVVDSHGFLMVEGMQNVDALHNAWRTAGVPDQADLFRAIGVSQVNVAGIDRIPDGFTYRHNSTGEPRAQNKVNQGWMLAELPRRNGWKVENNVALQADYPAVDGSQNGYIHRSGNPLNANGTWNDAPRVGSSWTGNALSGVFNAGALIPGDVSAMTRAALGVNADLSTVPGGIADGKGADLGLLAAGLDGVETGL